MTDAEKIQVGSAIASVLVAALAVVVAWKARGVAQDANKISGDASRTARDALLATRRQTALGAVPFLTMQVHEIAANGNFVFVITNGGPTVAYGIIVSVAVARSRNIDDVDKSTQRASGRWSAHAPEAGPLYRSVSGSELINMAHPRRPVFSLDSGSIALPQPAGCQRDARLPVGWG